MNNKLFFPFLALFLLLAMGAYFLLNPSYEKSIQAKYYYETGSYKEAYVLANEAFSVDIYNRMASTIMAQSKTALKYADYINTAKNYMKEINEIATHETISAPEKAKIRMMCEIMVDSYVKLAPSVITNIELVDEATLYYKDFEKLLEKVNR